MSSGTNPSTGRSRGSVPRFALLTTIVLMSAARTAPGAFVGPVAGSVAGVTYQVSSVIGPGGPVYGANNELLNINGLPGAGAYPSIGAPVTPVSTFGGGIAAPAAPLGALS